VIRNETIQKAKKEIASFRKQLKTVEKDIIKTGELVLNGKYSPEAADRKERHFRAMKRKLSEMQNNLKALQEGQEPEKTQGRNLRRPANESRLTFFCEV